MTHTSHCPNQLHDTHVTLPKPASWNKRPTSQTKFMVHTSHSPNQIHGTHVPLSKSNSWYTRHTLQTKCMITRPPPLPCRNSLLDTIIFHEYRSGRMTMVWACDGVIHDLPCYSTLSILTINPGNCFPPKNKAQYVFLIRQHARESCIFTLSHINNNIELPHRHSNLSSYL